MQHNTHKSFPGLVLKELKENVTDDSHKSVEQKIESLRREIGNELFDELCVRNRMDLQLYSYARGLFHASLQQLSDQVGSAQ